MLCPCTDLECENMLQRPRLLLVDDDASFRRLVSHHLRRHFLVTEASNGEEALNRVMAITPECVLLDMEMPGWSGIETLEQMRSLPRMEHVPIIMLTGNSDRDKVIASLGAGVSDYVLKQSCNGAELVTRILHMLPQYAQA
ncbi:response regulator [bacterium]|nr:response regulator [bacterium]